MKKKYVVIMMTMFILLININVYANEDIVVKKLEENVSQNTSILYPNDNLVVPQNDDLNSFNLNSNSNQKITNVRGTPNNYTITSNTAMTHTQEQIIQMYNEMGKKFDYSQSIYTVVPTANGTYIPGSLKQGVITDTVNQLNFFRWMTGFNNTVSLYSQYLERNQKGAVLLSAENKFAHVPPKPSNMSQAFYDEAVKGTNAGYEFINSNLFWWEGNIAYGVSLPDSVKEYIDDSTNIHPDVGHRNSLLSPRVTGVSVGACNSAPATSMYSTMSIFITNNDLGNNDKFYTWPPAGHVLTELVNPASMWSINVYNINPDFNRINELSIKYMHNGHNYILNTSNTKIETDDYFGVIYFSIPDSLKQELLENCDYYAPGKTIDVEVTGLYDNSGNSYTLKYIHRFFTASTKVPTNAEVYIDGLMFSDPDNRLIMYGQEEIGDHDLSIWINPYDVVDKRYRIVIDDPSIVSISEDYSIIRFLQEGETTMHIISEASDNEIGTVKLRSFKRTIPNNFTGLHQTVNGLIRYYENGRVVFHQGLINYEGNWYYVDFGILSSETTLVEYKGSWFYVENGQVNWNYTGLFQYKGAWLYIEKGQVNWNYTGLCQYKGTWFYIQGGMINWTAETLVNYNNIWFKVKGGVVDWGYTGLFNYKGTWFYIQGGMINWNAKTLVNYNGNWFYVQGGSVAWNFTGIVAYNGYLFYIQNGLLTWGYNGTITYNNATYIINNSIAYKK